MYLCNIILCSLAKGEGVEDYSEDEDEEEDEKEKKEEEREHVVPTQSIQINIDLPDKAKLENFNLNTT